MRRDAARCTAVATSPLQFPHTCATLLQNAVAGLPRFTQGSYMFRHTPIPDPPRRTCTLEHLSTDEIEPRLRFEAWRTRAHRLVDLQPPRPGSTLNAELTTLRDGQCDFGAARSSDYATRADPRHHPACAGMAVMTFIVAGTVRVCDTRDHRQRIAPGSLALYDVTRAACYDWSGPSRELYLALPRADAMAAMGGGRRPLIVPLDQGALAPALRCQLAVLARLALTSSPEECAGLLVGARALALLALHQAASQMASDDGADDALGSLAAGRRAAALHFMARQAHRPALDADDIARGTGCSRTRLYAAFAEHDETVMGALRELRLQRARAALDDGEQVHLGALAWRCGFADPSHFSRAFKTRFGLTPTAWARRAQAARLESVLA